MSDLLDLPRYDPDHWQNDAQCFVRGVDANAMQPERATREEVAEALAVCTGCPVLEQCAGHAAEQNARHAEAQTGAYGIHGGVWHGPDPVWLEVRTCEAPGCGKSFRAPEAGPQRFCDATCRKRDSRARKVSA